MAEKAIKAGIVEILPIVSAADKPSSLLMKGWNNAVKVARMNTQQLGIDTNKLESMPIENRMPLVLQKRVEVFRIMPP